jgi:hypothetical protein
MNDLSIQKRDNIRSETERYIAAFQFCRRVQQAPRVDVHGLRLPGLSDTVFSGSAQFDENGRIDNMRVVCSEAGQKLDLRLTSREHYNLIVRTVLDSQGRCTGTTRAIIGTDGHVLEYVELVSEQSIDSGSVASLA